MKYKNLKKKLEARIKDFESNRAIADSNRQHPGSYTKPGSQNKHKN